MEEIDYLTNVSSDVAIQLERNEWIKSYHIHLQQLNRVIIENEGRRTKFRQSHQSGIALQLISNNDKFVEISANLSIIPFLSDLPPPKSTQKNSVISHFPMLKTPYRIAIYGDEASSVTLSKDALLPYIARMETVDTESNLTYQKLEIMKEKRIILANNSPHLESQSLRTKYTNAQMATLDDKIYGVSDEYGSRNIDFDFDKITRDVSMKLRRKSRRFSQFDSRSVKTYVIHPSLIGKILAVYAKETMLINPQKPVKIEWNEQIVLYDDPQRDNGYDSEIFDDEGTLTSTKILIEGGRKKQDFKSMKTTNWVEGGNGYRVQWYQPIKRSFQYDIGLNFSNLVLHGGLGKGRNFYQDKGYHVYIVKGMANITGNPFDPSYVIHSSEAELWKDGDFIGPVSNISISGKINDFFKKGIISSEQILNTDNATPGSVYCGWMSIRSNDVQVSV